LEKYKRIEDLVDFIAERYENAAEIGVGHFPDVALGLQKRGVKVFATDIRPFLYDGVDVIVDDITSPSLSLYKGIDLIYSLSPPPELVPFMARLAKTISADVIMKPLSSEYPEGWKLMKNGDTTFFIREYGLKIDLIKNPPQSPFAKSRKLSGLFYKEGQGEITK